jgi:hypothetical protein
MKKRVNFYLFSLLTTVVLMTTSQIIKAEYACVSEGVHLSKTNAHEICPEQCREAYADSSSEWNGIWYKYPESKPYCGRADACECESCCDQCNSNYDGCGNMCGWGPNAPNCWTECALTLSQCRANCGGCPTVDEMKRTLPTEDLRDNLRDDIIFSMPDASLKSK